MNHIEKSGYNFWVGFDSGDSGITISVECTEDTSTNWYVMSKTNDEKTAYEVAERIISEWVDDLNK